ncbi:MAG: glycerol-3-phosphate dehydrogenase/oxidase [bacterium]|nr:glycerol-3-phosphate dehydrogenase/oxidase [bacterium]
MPQTEHDVIIIGGGINGVGIARDCALRGIKVLLIEKHDFAKGASGNNTGMIHGGIRYLRFDVGTTKLSCTDSGYIQQIAPHLLSRIPFLFPVLEGDLKGRLLLEGAEIFFESYDVFQGLKRGKKHTRLTRAEALALEPGLSKAVIGAVTLDEWGINAYRLTVENALDAALHGASMRTYCEFTDFIQNADGSIVGVKFYDRIRKGHETHLAPIVINATGAWGPLISAKLGVSYKLRQGKGVHVVFSHRISNYGMIMNAVDGRQMFFLPQETKTVIGTTDDDFYGDLDNPSVLNDEVKYIIQSARHVFPAIDAYREMSTYVGVRPTIYQWGKSEDALSREHEIIDHGENFNHGLFSVTGGKLAAYRQLAEEVTNTIATRLKLKTKCTTHEVPLPGGRDKIDIKQCAKELNLSQYAVAKTVSRFGSCALVICDDIKKNPQLAEEVCLCEPVNRAEIEYSANHELTRTLNDLRGRINLSKGLCGGCHCALRSSQIFAAQKQLAPAEELVELSNMMNETFIEKRKVLNGANLASQEMNQYSYFLTANMKPFIRAAEHELGLKAEKLETSAIIAFK